MTDRDTPKKSGQKTATAPIAELTDKLNDAIEKLTGIAQRIETSCSRLEAILVTNEQRAEKKREDEIAEKVNALIETNRVLRHFRP